MLWADFIIYQTTMMLYVTVLFLLRFSYYSAQNAWFNLILLGYLLNVLVICTLYTMALFPNLYVRLSSIVVNLLARIHLVKDREQTLANWNLQLSSFTTEIKKLTKDKKLILENGRRQCDPNDAAVFAAVFYRADDGRFAESKPAAGCDGTVQFCADGQQLYSDSRGQRRYRSCVCPFIRIIASYYDRRRTVAVALFDVSFGNDLRCCCFYRYQTIFMIKNG